MQVAQAVAEALVAEGITLAAGISGTHIGQFLNALSAREEITLMYARQERAALDICDGFARASGKPAVVFTDSGPAAANLMGGLVNSWGDSTPVLLFAGHNDRTDTAARTTKEIPFLDLFRPVAKWAAIIEDPSQTAELMRRAFTHLTAGRPGPVVIGVPLDVSSTEIGEFNYRPVSANPRIRCGGDPDAIGAAIDLLAGARNPYLYVGAGILVSEASDDLVRFAEQLTLPVATTLNGKSAFPEDHPLSLGIGGYIRAAYTTLPAARVAEHADVILTIGCGFKQHTTRKRPGAAVRHIQIDIEPTELNRDHIADVTILADSRIALRQLIEAARHKLPAKRLQPDNARLAELAKFKQDWEHLSAPLVTSAETPINPFRVTRELAAIADPARTIVLHDAGTVRGTTAQHYVATTPRSFLGFGVQSAMGWSIGAALGAKKAFPDKLVVAVIGEEAFAETALEIETSLRNEAPVLVIVKNNRRYVDQPDAKNRRLLRARFHQGLQIGPLVTALGALALRVERPDEIAPALRQAIAEVESGRTAVVEILTVRTNASLHTLWEQPA